MAKTPALPARLTQPADLLLARRLAALGVCRLAGVQSVTTHTNRTVMVSLTSKGILRIHRGYAYSPDRVLKAILRFLRPRTPRDLRKAAEREFLAFPVEKYAPSNTRRGLERPRPGDLSVLHRLERMHQRLNAEHFGGRLRSIPFRLSGRMRTRLGELSIDLRNRDQMEIAVSRAHLREHGWAEVEHTVLHEMIHQWQAEQGLAVDHGPTFRALARGVGVEPSARRKVRTLTRRASSDR